MERILYKARDPVVAHKCLKLGHSEACGLLNILTKELRLKKQHNARECYVRGEEREFWNQLPRSSTYCIRQLAHTCWPPHPRLFLKGTGNHEHRSVDRHWVKAQHMLGGRQCHTQETLVPEFHIVFLVASE